MDDKLTEEELDRLMSGVRSLPGSVDMDFTRPEESPPDMEFSIDEVEAADSGPSLMEIAQLAETRSGPSALVFEWDKSAGSTGEPDGPGLAYLRKTPEERFNRLTGAAVTPRVAGDAAIAESVLGGEDLIERGMAGLEKPSYLEQYRQREKEQFRPAQMVASDEDFDPWEEFVRREAAMKPSFGMRLANAFSAPQAQQAFAQRQGDARRASMAQLEQDYKRQSAMRDQMRQEQLANMPASAFMRELAASTGQNPDQMSMADIASYLEWVKSGGGTLGVKSATGQDRLPGMQAAMEEGSRMKRAGLEGAIGLEESRIKAAGKRGRSSSGRVKPSGLTPEMIDELITPESAAFEEASYETGRETAKRLLAAGQTERAWKVIDQYTGNLDAAGKQLSGNVQGYQKELNKIRSTTQSIRRAANAWGGADYDTKIEAIQPGAVRSNAANELRANILGPVLNRMKELSGTAMSEKEARRMGVTMGVSLEEIDSLGVKKAMDVLMERKKFATPEAFTSFLREAEANVNEMERSLEQAYRPAVKTMQRRERSSAEKSMARVRERYPDAVFDPEKGIGRIEDGRVYFSLPGGKSGSAPLVE